MKPFPLGVGLCALGLALGSAGPAEAAWNNVFQVSCFRRGCRRPAVVQRPVIAQFPVAVAAAPDPCCNPCPPPPPVCTTRYIQRCYYQPVTSLQTKTYFEPVTTYRTSFYYEQVTSYRYSCAFDPCTCTYQKVACPVTSYALRAKSCPVQSWVQRCCSVPVTTYQRVSYWEPQTTCTTPCANGCAPVAAPVVPQVQVPAVQEQPSTPPPPTPPPPTVDEKRGGNGAQPFEKYYGPPNGNGNGGASFRQPLPGGAVPARPVNPAPVPAARPDRIASLPNARLEGQVVSAAHAPRPGAQVMFVSTRREAPNQTVTANAVGRFQVNLPAGGWLVYVSGSDGRNVFHSRIDVDGRQPTALTVMAR